MGQPTLIAYSLDEAQPIPVVLDTESRSPDRILLLDTFFHVVLWYGKNIASWRDQRIHEQPEFAYFGELLEKGAQDAEDLMVSRMPRPTAVVADQGTSQARFLVAKLNPSVSGTNAPQPEDDSPPPVFTDDVSLNVFIEHLRKLA